MRFHADLHVHSKHSRATSRDLDLEHLAWWAARKGIRVVATGDFTHPAWRAELKDKLIPAEPGLFRLRGEIEQRLAETLPPACRTPVRFMLEVEISTIYKKGDKTRKVHHLIYAPDLATVDRISNRLARIGNIASDGRPILGLDSRNLLEITLESSPDAYLVPAHIWTPWFAALGSMSGFDSIEDCYGDLAGRIFAVETGLSSDPPMNWRLSMLDRFRLVSNSDAHSPGKLGREATTFDCELDYFSIRRALETGQGFVGSVEFFPEEGKYHLDGHRKCGVRSEPQETHAHGGRCPVCGEPVTIGVLHRVDTLADRSEAEAAAPPTAGTVSNLVPLPEILAEIASSGTGSKTVARNYDRVVSSLGPELDILQNVPVEDVARAGSSLLAEALARLRAGKVIRDAGYDGEYGVIRLFEDGELNRLSAGGLLFPPPASASERRGGSTAEGGRGGGLFKEIPPHPPPLPTASHRSAGGGEPAAPHFQSHTGILCALDDDQRAAASVAEGALLILAGPGSGKTRTLTYRIAHLVAERGLPAESCLAVTFTRRAAAEMKNRLAQLLPADAHEVSTHTFHSLGLSILREHAHAAGLQHGFRVAGEAERVAALAGVLRVPKPRAQSLLRAISRAERMQAPLAGEVADVTAAYRDLLAAHNWIDFDDLVSLAVQAVAADPGLAALYRDRFRSVSVDEFQDIDAQQYRLVMLLAPPGANLCVIGDPDQAIYGFRGADASCFDRFKADYPQAKIVTLNRNYRSSGTIVAAAAQVIAEERRDAPVAVAVHDMRAHITTHTAATERAEAEFVVATIEKLIGGHSFFSRDSGRAAGAPEAALSFADFAVLYRTDAQSGALVEAFARSGLPFKKHAHAPLAEEPAVRAVLEELATSIDDPSSETDLPVQIDAAAGRLTGGQFEAADVDHARQRLGALARTCDNDRSRFTDALALATDSDFFDPRAERVSLLTLHAAKGLEFSVVFIVGLEDGLMPLSWGETDDDTVREERRLFYVGMTRAKDRLILSRALKRHWRGRVRAQTISPFLADIEAELIKHEQMRARHRKPEDRQLKLL
jgi:DNA helicase II / ATP-dependent DNA helicase PcrA